MHLQARYIAGLTLELFLDQGNYLKNRLSKENGARIVIHDPKTPPLPDENGLDLAPNMANAIAVQQTQIQRLTAPYTPNCTQDWKDTSYVLDSAIPYTLAVRFSS